MRLPLPVGMGKARMFNDVTDEQFEATFVLWESLCKDSTVSVRKAQADSLSEQKQDTANGDLAQIPETCVGA